MRHRLGTAFADVCTRTDKYWSVHAGSPASRGEGGRMQGLVVTLWVCVQGWEMHGVSFSTRSLSGSDYVMANWSRAGEGGRNKAGRGRERERQDHAWPFRRPLPNMLCRIMIHVSMDATLLPVSKFAFSHAIRDCCTFPMVRLSASHFSKRVTWSLISEH